MISVSTAFPFPGFFAPNLQTNVNYRIPLQELAHITQKGVGVNPFICTWHSKQ